MADRVYLIRHAHPDYPNGERMCLGQKLNLPLSDLGRSQAAIVVPEMRKCGVGVVYTSPLRRAVETARILSDGTLPVKTLDDLIEMNAGDWDGMRFSDIKRIYPDYFVNHLDEDKRVPPNGESDESGLRRALRALDVIERDPVPTCAMVSHSGIGRILLAHLSGLPMNQKRSVRLPYMGIAELRRTDGGWRVIDAAVNCGAIPQPNDDQNRGMNR